MAPAFCRHLAISLTPPLSSRDDPLTLTLTLAPPLAPQVKQRSKEKQAYLDAAGKRYPVRFVTYLTRFLLNFDTDVQQWWGAQQDLLPAFVSAEQGDEFR